jgi:hypothetical protein
MATLTAIVLFGSSAWTQAANYYISASGALGNGSGSSAANAADASTAAKYYAINQAESAAGTVIIYAAGTYLMQTGHTMFNGVTHQGAGIDSTIIKIADGTVSGWQPMWYAGGTLSGFKCLDATIDLNANNQPFWGSSGMSMAFAFPTADHCTIQRVKFIHMGAKGMESFPIFFIHGSSSKGNSNNNSVDSCIFTQPIASGNTNGGLTCIYMADSEPGITVDNTNVVSNCQFLDLKFPNSDLTYTQCVTCPVAINNFARGVDAFWFIEPGSQSSGNNVFFTGQTVQVTGNTITDSGMIARILMHANGTFAGDLNIQNNTVGMTKHPYAAFGLRGPQGFTIEDYKSGSPSLGNITIQNNTFTAPSPPWTANPVAVLVNPSSPNLFHLASLTVINNRFVNFSGDGSEIQANTAQVGTYTNRGNTFGPPLRPYRLQHPHH